MVAEDIEDWLDSWVENTLFDNDPDMTHMAERCRLAAHEAGITDAALAKATGNDLAGYLHAERDAIRSADGTF